MNDDHVAAAQQAMHGEGHDYTDGSPHLKHAALRERVERSLRVVVAEIRVRTGTCRVLEVGAGHGDFTDTLLGAGAEVTVTEMSKPSADRLARRFDADQRVTTIHDQDGSWLAETHDRFDVVAAISVLHHIPDYEAFVVEASKATRPGGAFVSWQDPTWYPRRDAKTRRAEQASYLTWRLRQGDVVRGALRRRRRGHGVYDETNASDMAEYHVVRQGVDELRLAQVLRERYAEVDLSYYWSTQSRVGQRLGSRFNLPTTFALLARGRSAAE